LAIWPMRRRLVSMARSLGGVEIGRILGALEIVSEVSDPAAFPDAAVAALRSLVPCEVATYNEVASGGRTIVLWYPEEVTPPPDAARVLESHAHEHPLVQEIVRTGDGSPRAISDFLTEDQFRALTLYREIFAPLGLVDQLAVGLPAPPPVIVGIALNRDRRGFDVAEREMANLLRPYLIQAHRAVHLAARLDAVAAIGLGDRFGFLVGHGGRVEPLHGELPGWCPAGELFPGGRLDDEMRGWFASEQRWSGNESLPPLSRPLVRRVRSGSFTLHRARSTAGPVLVVSRSRPLPQDGIPILRRLGLTLRESEVLALVAAGHTNEGVAAQLGVSRSTVKRHLESIYGKLGVRNRTEAATLAVDTLAHG